MSVAVNDLFLLTAVGTAFAQRIMLTHGYRVAATGADVTENAASLALMAGVAGGAGGSNLIEQHDLACLPPQYQLDRWEAQKVYPVRYRKYTWDRVTSGTNEETAEATNLAGTITMQTRIAGRGEQGVKHIGPLPLGGGTINDGYVTPAYKAMLLVLGTKLYTDVVHAVLGLTFKPCIIHRQLDEDGHVISMSSTDIFTAVASPVIGTMSRRTVGRGI